MFDPKIALLRSEEKLNEVVLRLLRFCGVSAGRVISQFHFFPEKPSLGHWSLATDTGLNLFELEEENLVNLALRTAFLRGLCEYEPLLCLSQDTALSLSVVHAMVADRLHLILDEMADAVGDRPLSGPFLFAVALPVLDKQLKALQWGPSLPLAFSHWIDKKTIRLFEGILTEAELHRHYEFSLQRYVETMSVEADHLIDLFETAHKKNWVDQQVSAAAEEVQKLQRQISDLGWEAKAKVFAELIAPEMVKLRVAVGQLEKRN